MSVRKSGSRIVLPVSAMAIGLAVAVTASVAPMPGFGTVAWAQGNGQGSQGDTGGGGQGSQSGQDNQGSQGQGQGGPGADSDGRGPQSGGPSENSGGGRPDWAKEGIPEVELGRLSVARSPDHVLDRAFEEALATLTPEMVEFYSMSLREMVYELSINFDDVSMIDSPLQNLALLRDILEDGTSDLTSDEIGVENGTGVLAAVLLGTASDKTIPVTTDTVIAVTTILGAPITGDQAERLAEAADAVRIAILAGHG